MVRLNTAQSVAAASWSAAKEDKLAICSGASSDVTVWNASTGRNDMTLACGQRVDPGQRGLLAIQTLKVHTTHYRCAAECVHGLAATGSAVGLTLD